MDQYIANSQIRQIVRCAFVAAALLVTGSASVAQQRVVANLPDAPVPKQQPAEGEQKSKSGGFKRTFEIMGSKSVFFPELAHSNKPMNTREKFQLAVDQSIAPSGLIVSGVTAAIAQADNSWPGYGQGWGGYGKRYGATLALNASTDMFGTFLLPSMLRQDPRYFVSSSRSAKRKIWYALTRVVVTRTDSGSEAPNWSGVLGALMAEGLANSYLPDAERTTGKTFERFGIQLGIVAGGNVAKEFWPAIFKRLRGKRGPNDPSPVTGTPPKP